MDLARQHTQRRLRRREEVRTAFRDDELRREREGRILVRGPFAYAVCLACSAVGRLADWVAMRC